MNILSMSGFVPEHICDTVRFMQYSGDRNISHYCGYASDFISQAINDDSVDGVVFPKSCDSSRIIPSYLQDCKKFIYQINVPVANVDGAEEYFAINIEKYKEAVEKYYNIIIEDVMDRTQKINNRNKLIGLTYENIANLSYTEYLKKIHEIMKKPLEEQIWIKEIPKRESTNKSVFLVGSFLSNLKIVEGIEHVGLTIVGDTLTESGRLVSRPTIECSEDTIYRGIAHSLLSARLSPTQDNVSDIINKDLMEINKKDAKGVIFVLQKYCEPYEYLYSTYKSKLDDMGISTLKLSFEGTEDDRKVSLAIEAFADTL